MRQLYFEIDHRLVVQIIPQLYSTLILLRKNISICSEPIPLMKQRELGNNYHILRKASPDQGGAGKMREGYVQAIQAPSLAPIRGAITQASHTELPVSGRWYMQRLYIWLALPKKRILVGEERKDRLSLLWIYFPFRLASNPEGVNGLIALCYLFYSNFYDFLKSYIKNYTLNAKF
jgi:hypothetical protein